MVKITMEKLHPLFSNYLSIKANFREGLQPLEYFISTLYQTKIDYIHLNSVKALAEDASLVSAVDRYTDVTYWSVNKTQVYKTP